MGAHLKATPGPWESDEKHHIFSGNRKVCIVRENAEANARLIAAAPELYDACLMAREVIAHEPFFDTNPALQDVLQAVTAALGKARGEQ